MKFNQVMNSIVCGVALTLVSQSTFASLLNELSEENQAKVKNGEQVAIYEDIPDHPWPLCKIYQRIHATPEEAVAVFSDFALQKEYIPNLQKSDVRGTDAPNVFMIDYEVSLPLGFGKEAYTAKDTISSYDNGSSYKVEWDVIPTPAIKLSRGSARFEPLGGETVIAYYNLVFPLRKLSDTFLVKNEAKKVVRKSVAAIGERVEKVKSQNPELLQKEIQALHSALNY